MKLPWNRRQGRCRTQCRALHRRSPGSMPTVDTHAGRAAGLPCRSASLHLKSVAEFRRVKFERGAAPRRRRSPDARSLRPAACLPPPLAWTHDHSHDRRQTRWQAQGRPQSRAEGGLGRSWPRCWRHGRRSLPWAAPYPRGAAPGLLGRHCTRPSRPEVPGSCLRRAALWRTRCAPGGGPGSRAGLGRRLEAPRPASNAPGAPPPPPAGQAAVQRRPALRGGCGGRQAVCHHPEHDRG